MFGCQSATYLLWCWCISTLSVPAVVHRLSGIFVRCRLAQELFSSLSRLQRCVLIVQAVYLLMVSWSARSTQPSFFRTLRSRSRFPTCRSRSMTESLGRNPFLLMLLSGLWWLRIWIVFTMSYNTIICNLEITNFKDFMPTFAKIYMKHRLHELCSLSEDSTRLHRSRE